MEELIKKAIIEKLDGRNKIMYYEEFNKIKPISLGNYYRKLDGGTAMTGQDLLILASIMKLDLNKLKKEAEKTIKEGVKDE